MAAEADPPAIDQSTLVVISATRNEHRSVALVLAEMARARDELDTMGIALELLVVDDSDTPETAEELVSEGKLRDLRVTVIKGPGRGIGAAFVAGFQYALDAMSPTLVASMDCDGQHDATPLPSLVRAKLAGDDLLVIGSRFVEGATLTGLTRPRKVISKVGNQLIRRLSHKDLPADATTSFRVFEPELARRFLRHGLVAGCTGYNFFSLFVLFAVINGPCREVPIHFRPRLVGSSKLTVQQCLQFARGLPDIGGRAAQWKRVNEAEPFGDATDIGCLQELARMPNYQRWIIEEMQPWLHGSILEVGAGIGNMTPYLAAAPGVTDVCALEPNPDAYQQLGEACEGIDGATATLGTVEVLGDRRFDTVVYINCLEHIRDEEGELQRVKQHLAGPDAHLIIFSPALEFLYGELDRVSGHWRRYSRPSLLAAVQNAGYEVQQARYVDLLSIAPYWLSNRVLKRDSIGDMSIDIYDRYYVRAARLLHKAVRSPLGKSLMCIATDPGRSRQG
jgi:SAM-dependent methyltransferase